LGASEKARVLKKQNRGIFMNRKQICDAVNEVFRDVFDDESISVNDKTVAADIEDWDSLEHINLILAIEQKFKIKFTLGEVTGMKNVGEMIDVILERAEF
jgi:acyl carrier protein